MTPETIANQRFVETLASKLRRRLVQELSLSALSLVICFSQVVGSRAAALETVLVLRQVVSKARFSNMEQLVEIIRLVVRRLVEAQPKGLYQSSNTFI
jgi:translation initiation factor eIF-2B subunit beta